MANAASKKRVEADPADTYDVTKAKRIRRGARVHRYTLAMLRNAVGKTQVEVASAIGVEQSAISKVEARDDALVSTLRAYGKALGLSLEIALVDGDRRYVIDLGE